jgi:pimeloyl-ACP methyl ester carboxylesterase
VSSSSIRPGWWTATSRVVVKGSGHWLMEEAPDQVIPKLVDFLGK